MPTLERSKLYQDVWSRPCTKIAAELGISRRNRPFGRTASVLEIRV